MHAALAEDQNSAPSILVKWLTTTCNSSPEDLTPSSGHPGTCTLVYITLSQIHDDDKLKDFFLKK